MAVVRAAVHTAMRTGSGKYQVMHTFFKSFCS